MSKDGGRATYRGQVKVAPGATNAVASVRCDALMLDDLSRSDTYPYIEVDNNNAVGAATSSDGGLTWENQQAIITDVDSDPTLP